MSAHLDEAALEALAHGRNDLVADVDRLHLASCATCGAAVEGIRELSRETALLLSAEVPAMDDLESLIAGALAKAPDPAVARPPLAVLAGAGLAGLAAAAILGVLSLPSTTKMVGFVRDTIVVANGADRLVGAFVPGGWSGIALSGFVLLVLLAFPLRRVLGAGRPSPLSALGIVSVLFAVGVSSVSVPSGALALTFEGEWPSPDEGHLVTLTVTEVPTSEALREAAAAAGLGYVSRLAQDRLDERSVSLDVRDAELRVVLETILGDADVVARRSARTLVLSPASSPAASPSAPAKQPPSLSVGGNGNGNGGGNGHQGAAAVDFASLPDRETFGGDVRIRRGEAVRHVTSTGGDVLVEGIVYGNVTSMGGDIEVEDGGVVHGELVSMGGDVKIRAGGAAYGQMVTMGGEVDVDEGAVVTGGRLRMDAPGVNTVIDEDGNVTFGDADGEPRGFVAWVKGAIESAARHALLFVLGVLLLALAPARLGALRRTIARAPLRSVAAGVMGAVGTVVLTVILVVTVIGIPAAVLLAIGAFLGAYVGLVACASVIGAALPTALLRQKPILQLGAGVAVLFVASLVPGIGGVLTLVAVVVGYGALMLTRFKPDAIGD